MMWELDCVMLAIILKSVEPGVNILAVGNTWILLTQGKNI